LGTPAYMSPEQASADRVDKRSDIWAFGCVLYEMLVGECAFRRQTVSGTLAAVVAADPLWLKLPRETPAGVDRLLRRCLGKDPKQRLRDIGEARIVLAQSRTSRTRRERSARSDLPPYDGRPGSSRALLNGLRPSASEKRPVLRFANELSVADVP